MNSDKHLEDWAVEEEGKQLNKIVMDVTVFFLNTNDVRRVIRLLSVHFQVLVEGEKAELEEVFDDNGNLKEKKIKLH